MRLILLFLLVAFAGPFLLTVLVDAPFVLLGIVHLLFGR